MPRAPEKPRPLDEDRDPWERQTGEGDRHHAAFALFRDLDPHDRQIKATAAQLGIHRSLLTAWSQRWRWRDRVAAYDRHRDNLRIQARVKEAIKAEERNARVAAAGIGVIGDLARSIVNEINEKQAAAWVGVPFAARVALFVRAVPALRELVGIERQAFGLDPTGGGAAALGGSAAPNSLMAAIDALILEKARMTDDGPEVIAPDDAVMDDDDAVDVNSPPLLSSHDDSAD